MSFKIPNVQLFASRPPGFYCYVCGKEYGSASLRLHFKSCIKQWEATENLKSRKDRRPTPTPPPELATIYDMMKRGVRIDPKIVDFYNEKAVRLWEEKFCMKCASCSRMIPHSLKDSHKKLCISMPHLNTPTESIQEAIIKDFPYEPKYFHLPTSFRPNTESTEHSINDSLGKISINKIPEEPEKEITYCLCDECGRKFSSDRIQKHKKACESQLKGQWKHDEMMKRAQARQLANLKFHDYEMRYKTHKWKNQHEELTGLFSNPQSAPKNAKDVSFELIHLDFLECNVCHRQFHPKRINSHTEHCQKTYNKNKERLLQKQQPDKLHNQSKPIKHSQQESLKAVNSPNAKLDSTKGKASLTTSPRIHNLSNNFRPTSSPASSNLMPKKPEFIKIKLKDLQEKENNPKEEDKPLKSPSTVKVKSLSHVQNSRKAGPSFDRKTNTAYLKSSDFVNK